jgi:hypothetical protein
MNNCIICGTPTNGSVGAAGIKWSCICQPCKDAEDRALASQLKIQAMIFDKLFSAVKDVQQTVRDMENATVVMDAEEIIKNE